MEEVNINETNLIMSDLKLIDDKEYQKKKNKEQKQLECDLAVLYIDKTYNHTDESILFLKNLKKELSIFHKEMFKTITPIQFAYINLLQNYPLNMINKAIKNDIELYEDIYKQKGN